jgi:hypothetical protein
MIVLLRVVLLMSLLVLSVFSIMTSTGSDSTSSSLQVEKAVDFLVNFQFNENLSLCREAPVVAPNTYWLVSENLLAWKALKVANETYYFGAGEVGQVADRIEAKLKEDAILYSLPRDPNGFPISFMHEAVIGDVIPTSNRAPTILTLHSDDYNLKMEICNGTVLPNWKDYTDRLLYMALSCFWQGNETGANLYFKNATARWDGIGINDTVTKAEGLYATYKLALLFYTSKVLGERLPFECELVKRIWSLQRESDGGIITNYYANDTQNGDANTETTSIVIIAVLTPPRARLGTFAFYYPWYGTPAVSEEWCHWNEGNSSGQIPHDPNIILPGGRRDIAAEDYPLLDPYDSNNESVIEQHVEWAKEAGIGCFIVSWWGQDSFEDKALLNISKVCEREKFNFTVYIENTSIYYQKPPSINQTVDDLTYLLNKYNDSSSWYRIDGRPVIFVYSQARDNLGPQEWLWHACSDSIGNDTDPNKIENAATQWLPSEEVRKPPRHGIIPIQPFKTTPGYIVTANPIHLQPTEQYWVNFGISDIRNDSKIWSDVGMRIKIGLDPTCNDTLYDQILNFTDGWIDLSHPINMTRYAGQDVYLQAESYNGGRVNWSSEWAAIDYLFINNSQGEIVSLDPFFDNGWNEVVHQIREKEANPYIIVDFGGFEGKIDGFLDCFQDCIDGIHVYNPTDYSEDPSHVLDIYNSASEFAHSRNMTFVATVVPGFNNTAVQTKSHVIDRRDGSYYSLYWLIARACSPDGYAITSFNEWHEGTEIEPSREYGHQYIYLTRCETIPEFSSTIVLPLFMIATLLAVIVYRRKDHKWRMKIKRA